jgi:hypothetical protein
VYDAARAVRTQPLSREETMSNKYVPITIDQVKDLPQNPALPDGYASYPVGPGAVAAMLGVESVRAFALNHAWDTPDHAQSAHGWANNAKRAYAVAATIREFPELTDLQRKSVNLSCNVANVFLGGKLGAVPFAYAYLAEGQENASVVSGGSFPANFLPGEEGDAGKTSFEAGPEDAKQIALDQLNRDIRSGAYLL